MQIKFSGPALSPRKRPLLGQDEISDDDGVAGGDASSTASAFKPPGKQLLEENERLRRQLRTMEERIQHHSQQMKTYESLMQKYREARNVFFEKLCRQTQTTVEQNANYYVALTRNYKTLIGETECIANCGESFGFEEDDTEETILTNHERIMKLACGHHIHARCASMVFSSEKNVFLCPHRCETQSRQIEASDIPSKSEYFGGTIGAMAQTNIDVLTADNKRDAVNFFDSWMPALPIYTPELFTTPPSREFPLVLSTPNYRALQTPEVLTPSPAATAIVAPSAPPTATSPITPYLNAN